MGACPCALTAAKCTALSHQKLHTVARKHKEIDHGAHGLLYQTELAYQKTEALVENSTC